MNSDTASSALPLLPAADPITLRLLAPLPLLTREEPAPHTSVVEPQPESLSALVCQQARPDKAEAWLYAAVSLGALAAVGWAVWDSLALAQDWQGLQHFVGQLAR